MCISIGTPRQVYKALKSEGIPLSETALRGLIATGEIPSLRSGRTTYIKLEAVKEYLDRRLSLPSEGSPVADSNASVQNLNC